MNPLCVFCPLSISSYDHDNAEFFKRVLIEKVQGFVKVRVADEYFKVVSLTKIIKQTCLCLKVYTFVLYFQACKMFSCGYNFPFNKHIPKNTKI